MRSSNEHLEEALAEYNQKVSDLELKGSREELLEALVNRSTILILMESFVSSITDLEEAAELADEMISDGTDVNVGTYVKIYENRGQLYYGEDNALMAADYGKIAERLNEMKDGVRHYDNDDIVEMCIGCAEDLIDEEFNENALPFTEKALELLDGKDDDWSLNYVVEAYNLIGQANKNIKSNAEAMAAFGKSIDYGYPLFKKSKLDDEMELVFSFVFRGDIEEEIGDKEAHIKDHESAISILEELYTENKLDDTELLINLHQGLATTLMDDGNIKDAEHHLLRVVDLGMPAMKDAIVELGIKKPSDQ